MKDKPIVENVSIEVSPETRANPPDPIEFVKALVEQSIAELVTRRDDFRFRPFFDEKRVSQEIKRLQTVPESLAWSRVFREHGCLHCHTRNAVHGGCGCCKDCYNKIFAWKKKAVRDVGLNEPDPEIAIKELLAACDPSKLAQAALAGNVAQLPDFTEPVDIEPPRHAAWCVICSHPHREEIEQDYIASGSEYGAIRAVVRRYGLKGTAGLYRHAHALGLNGKRAEKEGE
jgi:hypothetical protein